MRISFSMSIMISWDDLYRSIWTVALWVFNLLSSLSCGWEHGDSERLSKIPTVTKILSGKAKIDGLYPSSILASLQHMWGMPCLVSYTCLNLWHGKVRYPTLYVSPEWRIIQKSQNFSSWDSKTLWYLPQLYVKVHFPSYTQHIFILTELYQCLHEAPCSLWSHPILSSLKFNLY